MFMQKKDLETIENLLILLLLKEQTSYELVAAVTGINLKTLYQRFPKSKVLGSQD